MLVTIIRLVQHTRLKQVSMVEALGAQTGEKGTGPALKKLRKTTMQEEMEHDRQNCVDPLIDRVIGTEARGMSAIIWHCAMRCIRTARIGIIAPARYLGCCLPQSYAE
jgi:hypothetical protein